MNNLKDGLAKLGQTIYYARDVQINLPGALFVPNSLLNQFRREAADMLDAARLAGYQRAAVNRLLILRRFIRKRI